MHIEYWKCDFCKKVIDYDEKTKYTTPEMGLPYIPENGGGKHFHRHCLIEYYSKQKMSSVELQNKIEDAERRHQKQVERKLKKGKLTNKELTYRKSSKEDRENLINYFYNYYGLRSLTKKLGATIDALDRGESFGDFINVHIPFIQLKDMLVFYRPMLDSAFVKMKKKKGATENAALRIGYDISIIVNNLDDYAKRRAVVYNEINKVNVDGGESLIDNSAHMAPIEERRRRESEEENKRIDELKREWDEMISLDFNKED